MNKKGQFEFLEDVHPFAFVTGVIGALIGWYSIKVMSGGGFAVGEAAYELPLIWKILTPVVCGVACFMVGNKMMQ